MVACSPLNAKGLHASLKHVVLKTYSRDISPLDYGMSIKVKRTVHVHVFTHLYLLSTSVICYIVVCTIMFVLIDKFVSNLCGIT